MELKRFNLKKQVLKFAPNKNNVEHMGHEHKVDIAKTLDKLKKEYQFTVFFGVDIIEAVRKARKYGIVGLVISSINQDFEVLDGQGFILDNNIAFKATDSNIKNQTKRHNSSNDQKLRIATGQRRAEAFRLYAQGVKVNNKIFG